MSKFPLQRWTERTFNFEYPIGYFPCILTRLRGTIARVNALSLQCSRDVMKTQHEGKWSIQEHVGHLIDLEALHEGRIDDFRNRETLLRAADMKNTQTYAAEHNSRAFSEIAEEFGHTRLHFIARLETFSPEELEWSALHPRLQKQMRVVDLAYFVAEHDDHHFAIIDDLVATYCRNN